MDNPDNLDQTELDHRVVLVQLVQLEFLDQLEQLGLPARAERRVLLVQLDRPEQQVYLVQPVRLEYPDNQVRPE